MEGFQFDFDKESLLKDITDEIGKNGYYKNVHLKYNKENILMGPGSNPQLNRTSRSLMNNPERLLSNISKYERYMDESPDIYSIIQKEEEFVKTNKLEEYRLIPCFCRYLSTNEIILLYKKVKKYDKQFIKDKIKDKILANHIINSNINNIFTNDISYICMVDTLRKLKEDYDLENTPSPEPAPMPEINNLSVVNAIPLTNTNDDEIKLLKEKIKIMENQMKILMDWYDQYNHLNN